MVRKSYNLLDMLDEWSEGRHEIDVYTGAEEPSYSGFIIHVGEDYLAMGDKEGINLYDTLIPVSAITRIRILIKGTGVKSWKTQSK